MKKSISLLLVFALLLCVFSSCGQPAEEEPSAPTEGEYKLPTPVIRADIALPYTGAEKIDVYASESELNRDLLCTVYEGLFYPSADGKGSPVLASSYQISGKSVTVKLLQGVKFSDGTELTAAAVKFSYDKAKNCKWYSEALADIESVTAIDNYTVRFSFYSQNDMPANTLAFPIVKQKDGVYSGTGKYTLAFLDGEPYLEVNKLYRSYSEKYNRQVALYDMSGVSSPVYPFKANKISVYKNTLADGQYTNLSSQTVSLTTDNLVYIGLNSTRSGSLASMEWLRHVINIGISRSTIGSSSFLGQTDVTVTPFKAQFYKLADMELAAPAGDTQRAAALLEEHGFIKQNADGIKTDGAVSLRLSLLVCSDNPYKVGVAETVKQSLEALGIGVNIQKRNSEDYVAALEEGYFDMYIGEVSLTADCSLKPFFKKNGSASYGISDAAAESYSDYLNGSTTVSQFVENFYMLAPFVPLFYRKTVVSVNPNITGCAANGNYLYASVSDWQLS